jgi:broad-specificity NMP kinase
MKIGIVGPCAAGKTALAKRLCALGYDAHDIAQEHSLVPTMWHELTQPDVLIYLDASLDTIRRRLDVNWERAYVDELLARVADARNHADLSLDTSNLSEAQVVERVMKFLSQWGNPPMRSRTVP